MSWSSRTTTSLRPSPSTGESCTSPSNPPAPQHWPPSSTSHASAAVESPSLQAAPTSTSISSDTRSPAERRANGKAPRNVASAPQLGDALKALRRQRGYSLVQVAKETGISKSFLSLVESGRSDITIGRLLRLVTFYGAHIADLLPQTEPHDPVV